MADEARKKPVSLEELMVSTLAMTDALAKLLIAKGIITGEEFSQQLSAERANYLAVPEADAVNKRCTKTIPCGVV